MTQRIAVAYTRVSTKEQTEGHSMETQEDRIHKFCDLREWTLDFACDDRGKSGRKGKYRPGLKDAIERTCREGGVLVVAKLCRLTRSTEDALGILRKLKKHGADLAVVDLLIDTSTAFGTFSFTLRAAMDQLESDQISERIKVSQAHVRKTCGGNKHGRQPCGWKIDENGDRVPAPEELEWLVKVMNAYETSGNYRQAANCLSHYNYPTLTKFRQSGYAGYDPYVPPGEASKWSGSMVHRLLAN